MDLIYADKTKTDIGVMKDFQFDLAFGQDENDFELTVSTNNNVCTEDYLIYLEGTEYGGLIDTIEVYTALNKIIYEGRTFHGILNSKIIVPASGYDYYTVSGEANTILGTLITKLNLGSLFKASTEVTTITISSYQFQRYVAGYDGIMAMLQSVGAKLHIEWSEGYVVLSALAAVNYTNEELTSDHVNLHIRKLYNPVNHLICLGQGELRNRTVVNLYCDASGNISTTQSITGIDEVVAVYDYPNAESSADLTRDGTKKLRELNGDDLIDVNVDNSIEFDIGDTVHAQDVITGISVARRVVKKIVTIKHDRVMVNYKVGE